MQFVFEQVKSHELFSDLQPHIIGSFWLYHTENLHIFELFERFANELRDKGRPRYGVKAIMERIRWHFAVETKGDEFKINNNYTSCYARLLIMKDASFRDFFELRCSPGWGAVDKAEEDDQESRRGLN